MEGEFTHLDMTIEEMKELVSNKIVAMKIPKFIAKFPAKSIHTLERWK